jgi:hypothetical protein
MLPVGGWVAIAWFSGCIGSKQLVAGGWLQVIFSINGNHCCILPGPSPVALSLMVWTLLSWGLWVLLK